MDNNKKQEPYNYGSTLFLIYPDYWKKSWGEKPLLGTVYADSEYWAKYAAYDKKLLPYNATFGPNAVLASQDKMIHLVKKHRKVKH